MKKNKKIFWKNYELKYQHFPNKGQTLIMVHGFNASGEFAIPFLNWNKDFNIYTIDLPGSKNNPTKENVSIEIYSILIKKMLRILKLKKIILFGHSMGAAVVAKNSHSWRVKKVFYLCPLHSNIIKTHNYIKLKKHYYPKNDQEKQKTKLRNKLINKLPNIKKVKQVKSFLSQDSSWAKIVVNNLLNDNYLETLSKQMKKTLSKAIFLIAKNDNIVGTEFLVEWLNYVNKNFILVGEGHSPLEKYSKDIYKLVKKYS